MLRMKKMHLGQQLLLDRKQLKNFTWPITFADKVVELHLPPLALLQNAQQRELQLTKEPLGLNGLLAVHRADTYHGRQAPDGNTDRS